MAGFGGGGRYSARGFFFFFFSKDVMVSVSPDQAGSYNEARWQRRDRRCENDGEAGMAMQE